MRDDHPIIQKVTETREEKNEAIFSRKIVSAPFGAGFSKKKPRQRRPQIDLVIFLSPSTGVGGRPGMASEMFVIVATWLNKKLIEFILFCGDCLRWEIAEHCTLWISRGDLDSD